MKEQKSQSPLNKIRVFLLYSFPVVLYCSYYPIIRLPLSQDSMNLELSLPLIWLFLFSILSLKDFLGRILSFIKNHEILFVLPLAFSIFLSFSIIWSKNPLRALLTSGILWCIYILIYTVVPKTSVLKLDKSKFSKIFLLGAVLFSLICWIQCILDVAGVPRSLTLLCRGCTSNIFGFPHPSGFAIEPQFMGNLLIAPALFSIYLLFSNRYNKNLFPKQFVLPISIFITSTLFLTFSRGAIYAFLVGLLFLIISNLCLANKKTLLSISLIISCFFLSLVAQGLFSQLSYTNDTFFSGIDKVISQLSLGEINPNLSNRCSKNTSNGSSLANNSQDDTEDPLENLSVFSGYVEESTTTRLDLNVDAIQVSALSFRSLLFGYGLGSAGTILFEQGKTASKMEIIQNEYFSLLLEVGIAGLSLALAVLISIILLIKKTFAPRERFFLYSVIIAFLVSLNFFSGLPNALHIYLFPAFLVIMLPRSLRLPLSSSRTQNGHKPNN